VIAGKALLRSSVLLFCITGALGSWALPVQAGSPATNKQKMLEFNNAERNARGIRPLARSSTLDAEAQRWAEKLASEGQMYHRPSIYAVSVGFRSGAENLAWHDDSISASFAHDLWMSSSTHRRNMLDPAFNSAGFGIACSTESGRPYAIAVVEFGGDASPTDSIPDADPHVAGRQSIDGVGCSASDVDPPASDRAISGTAVPTSPPPSNESFKTPNSENRQTSAEPSASAPPPQTSVDASRGASSPSPPGAAAKSKPPPSTSSPNAGKTAPPGSAAATGVAIDEDHSGELQSPDDPELAAAATRSSDDGSGRLAVTVTAAILMYLLLIRFMGFRRPPRRRNVPRHSFPWSLGGRLSNRRQS
jgi:hypothetical protein